MLLKATNNIAATTPMPTTQMTADIFLPPKPTLTLASSINRKSRLCWIPEPGPSRTTSGRHNLFGPRPHHDTKPLAGCRSGIRPSGAKIRTNGGEGSETSLLMDEWRYLFVWGSKLIFRISVCVGRDTRKTPPLPRAMTGPGPDRWLLGERGSGPAKRKCRLRLETEPGLPWTLRLGY